MSQWPCPPPPCPPSPRLVISRAPFSPPLIRLHCSRASSCPWPYCSPTQTRPHPTHTTSPHAALLNSAGGPRSRSARSQSRPPRRAIAAPTLSHSLSHNAMLTLPSAGFRPCDDRGRLAATRVL